MSATLPRAARRPLRVLAAVLALTVAASGCGFGGGGGTELTGVFADGTGIYPSSPVRLRGVDVGQVTDIRTSGGLVEVDLSVDDDVELPSDTGIVIIPLTLLGERYLQLMPGEADTELEDGAVIPLERTGKPAELDELLEGLEDLVTAIDEDEASRLLVNLAEALEDNGSELNELIRNGAGTVDLLADSADDLNTVVSALATLSETVASRSDTIQQLVANYDTLSGALAANQDALSDTVSELDDSLLELARLLVENEDEVNDSVETLTQVGRTLDRNHQALSDLLRYTVDLFAAADLAYDREHNWLPLNVQLSAVTYTEVIGDRLANRLAGICRRLEAGMGGGAPAEILECAAGAGPILDLIGQLPELFESLVGGGATEASARDAAAEATLLTGLGRILELVPDLDRSEIGMLSELSEQDDRALLDLLEQTPPEEVPDAVEQLLGSLRGERGAADRETGPGPSAELHDPPPRRSLDEVYAVIDDLLGGLL